MCVIFNVTQKKTSKLISLIVKKSKLTHAFLQKVQKQQNKTK